MKKAFIDLGGHRGESIKAFMDSKDYDSEFEIHCFEPDPLLYSGIYRKFSDINLYNYAAHAYDGLVCFYPSTIDVRGGGSVCSSKTTGHIDKDNPYKVPCIDFSKWIKDCFDIEDTIIVRMNIEGAEYPVLNKMIMDGTIKYIDFLSVSFHHTKINYPHNMHLALVEELGKYVKIRITTNSKELF